MQELEELGKQILRSIGKAIAIAVGLQLFIVFAAVVGVALEFLFAPTPVGRITLLLLTLE